MSNRRVSRLCVGASVAVAVLALTMAAPAAGVVAVVLVLAAALVKHLSAGVTRHKSVRGLSIATIGALVCAGLMAPAGVASAAEGWSPRSSYTSTDKGDGSYSVPLLNSDVPDISVERVPAAENDEGRDVYYMISTTMHLSPGAPIMKSYDLVNWEIVNYVFDRASIGDAFSLRNGQNSYGQGQWASSLRYHDGMFYVVFNTNNLGGAYLYRTDDIDNGAWQRTPLGRGLHDPSLFFDVDGTAYIFYGSGGTSAVRLNSDLTAIEQTYSNIFTANDYAGKPFIGGLFEGAQFYYIDGYYYAVIITWPSGQGRQVVMFRSRDLLGRYTSAGGVNTYEARGVLNSNGFAQGSLVPISREGGGTDWYGMFFRDTFPIGRIPALIPATWQDGWPTFGNNGVVPVDGVFEKPIKLSPADELFERQKSVVASDDFANDAPHRKYTDEEWAIPEPPEYDESLIGVELLQNPGFESGSVSPWGAQYGATVSLGSADPAAGSAALKVSNRTLNGSGPNQFLNGKMQHGLTYTVSAKIKYTSGPSAVQFNLAADWGAGVQVMASRSVPVGQWTTVSGQYTVPATANLDNFKFAVETPWANPQPPSSSVEYLIDDVSIIGQPVTAEYPTEEEIKPNGSRLDVAWQWNHAPDNRYWSLTDRDGWLRLTTGKVVTGKYVYTKLSNRAELAWFEEARNTLSQRTFGPRQSAETKLDIGGMKNGDVAGLAAYNRGFSYVAVKRTGGANTLGIVNRVQPFAVDLDQATLENFLPGTTVSLGDATEVYLKADLDFASPVGQLWTTFYYSLDGLNWTRLGSRVGPQTLDGSLAHFMGHRVGLFNYATQETGGHVDFDYYLLSDKLTAQGLPLDTTDLDAAIAHAGTLDKHYYPKDAWAAMQAALAGAKAARAGGFGSQNQIDAPERALSYQLARLGVLRTDTPSLDLSVVAGTRCADGRAMVTVQVTNNETVQVRASATSAYGQTPFGVLPAGKQKSRVFPTGAARVPAGELTVTGSARLNGVPAEVTVTAPYEARSCD
ncbi:family 43 glycosylhydrolase [Micromonospora avicenniae]|uniref:Carbohydrate binding domain-containing protein n=1 Tax=Micromonospora avicenniae TaxID=1198245 RepID=A0A1N7ENK8_9ACTN|nr:family 43 glycosylhydrolase [Micromonospora avicenniae]SIR89650.1 Carbohydrate binding domain-containing protein [Micromonospora avicenniae]